MEVYLGNEKCLPKNGIKINEYDNKQINSG